MRSAPGSKASPAKRAGSPAPGDPWAAIVERVRARAADERWRLAALASVPSWRVFLVAWQTAAAPIAGAAALVTAPPAADRWGFDSLLTWAWAAVEDRIDPVLEIIDARSGLPALEIVTAFETLRSAALIYPDGTVHAAALERISTAQILRDATATAAARRAVLGGMKASAAIDTHRAAQQLAAQKAAAVGGTP